jgi:ANTAR domain/GAF domain
MGATDTSLARTFVEAADTLVADFDVVDFLTTLSGRCVELFDASEAGIMLAGPSGGLHVAASSSRSMSHLELFEIQHNEGPCVDCYREGVLIESKNLDEDRQRWPTFAPEALREGYRSAYALPMRLRDTPIGSLNLLRVETGPLGTEDLRNAQALADIATIGLLHHRAADDSQLLTEQLQFALNSRVVIEQAKGVLAQHGNLSIEDAFGALRRYARNHNQRLNDVAQAVAGRTLSADEVVGSAAK